MQTSRRVQNNRIVTVCFGIFHSLDGDFRGIDLSHFEKPGFCLSAYHSQLLDCRRSVNIAPDKQGIFALFFEVNGKLAAHSGFSRALESAHHDDGRKPARNLELALHRSHKLGKLLVDDFYHLLRRSQTFKHLLSYGFFAHVGNKLLRNGHVYVGFQQSDAHLAHGLLYFQFRQRSAVGQLGKNMIYSLTESRKQCHSFSPRRLRAFPQAPPRHLSPDTMFSAFCKFQGFLRFFLQSPI